jgi:hypothetical protein
MPPSQPELVREDNAVYARDPADREQCDVGDGRNAIDESLGDSGVGADRIGRTACWGQAL